MNIRILWYGFNNGRTRYDIIDDHFIVGHLITWEILK